MNKIAIIINDLKSNCNSDKWYKIQDVLQVKAVNRIWHYQKQGVVVNVENRNGVYFKKVKNKRFIKLLF